MALPEQRREQRPPPVSAASAAPAPGVSDHPFVEAPSLLDVLQRLMDHGIVIEPSARAALPELDIAAGEASVAVAAVDTLSPAADVWRDLVAAAERADAASAVAGSATDERRSGGTEMAALKRQLERLDA